MKKLKYKLLNNQFIKIMKTRKISLILATICLISFTNCTHDDAPECEAIDPGDGVGQSDKELLVKKVATAPEFDGKIDDMWKEARPLVNKATVSIAGDRIITLNGSSNGDTSLEPTDLMEPYAGESYSYTLRGMHDGTDLFLLFEWEDDTDSRDRQSWFFNEVTSKWQQENKYANHKNDKFYEDKFGFMFPIGNVEGFDTGTCTVTCHGGLADPQPGEKVTRHYMKNQGELTDFWHWKRDRHALAEACDDGFVQWEEDEGMASANGRKNDDGVSPYSTEMKFTDDNGFSGPKYVIPGRENYYWITQTEIDNGTAVAVTGVSEDGVLTLADNTLIDPNDPNEAPAYSQGFGNKRMPSIIINPGGQGDDRRSEVQVRSRHTGSGWQLEIRRKLNTGDTNDVVFEPGAEIPFALAIFNNAAIGHGQSIRLSMKIEQ
jgi:hypothetical protein